VVNNVEEVDLHMYSRIHCEGAEWAWMNAGMVDLQRSRIPVLTGLTLLDFVGMISAVTTMQN